jgi:hypothetical protein
MIIRAKYIIGIFSVVLVMSLAVTVTSSFAAGEWLENGKAIAAAAATRTTGELNLISLKSAGGTALVEFKCSGEFDGTVGPGGADSVTDLRTLMEEVIGGLGDTNEKRLNCTVTATAKELGDCIATGELAEVLPTNLNLELGSTWATLVELMAANGVNYYLDLFPATSGYEIKCKTSIGELENRCEGATSAFLINNAGAKGVTVKFGREVNGGVAEESEPTNCNLVGAGTGTLSGEILTTLNNGAILTVSE